MASFFVMFKRTIQLLEKFVSIWSQLSKESQFSAHTVSLSNVHFNSAL